VDSFNITFTGLYYLFTRHQLIQIYDHNLQKTIKQLFEFYKFNKIKVLIYIRYLFSKY